MKKLHVHPPVIQTHDPRLCSEALTILRDTRHVYARDTDNLYPAHQNHQDDPRLCTHSLHVHQATCTHTRAISRWGTSSNRNPSENSEHKLDLATARTQIAAREIVLWTTPSEPPKALQASECSELLDPMRASCLILAQHQPGKFMAAHAKLSYTFMSILSKALRHHQVKEHQANRPNLA